MHPNDGRVVSSLIVQALLGRELTIYGAGNQTRSFCYVDDLVEGLIGLMQLSYSPETPINLGNPVEFSINELAHLVVEATGSKSKISYRQLPTDDPKQRKPDINLAQTTLGWNPKVSLDEGLIRTIGYFDELLKSDINTERLID
jgi:UDP-glucuronate decarboxylase